MNLESRTFAGRALHLKASPLAFDEALAHNKPKPNPLCLRGEEGVEYLVEVLLWDAGAGVLESHKYSLTVPFQ